MSRVENIKSEREKILNEREGERKRIVSKSTGEQLKSGLGRLKAGAQRIGAAARDQVNNPDSASHKVAGEFKSTGKVVLSGARRVANSEPYKRVTANSVALVKASDGGVLNVHGEKAVGIKPNLFGNERSASSTSVLGGGTSYGGGFSIMGEGHPKKQSHSRKQRSRRTQTVVVTKVYRKVGRRKHKRKPAQSAWTLF